MPCFALPDIGDTLVDQSSSAIVSDSLEPSLMLQSKDSVKQELKDCLVRHEMSQIPLAITS
jgi:hypothetical protein